MWITYIEPNEFEKRKKRNPCSNCELLCLNLESASKCIIMIVLPIVLSLSSFFRTSLIGDVKCYIGLRNPLLIQQGRQSIAHPLDVRSFLGPCVNAGCLVHQLPYIVSIFEFTERITKCLLFFLRDYVSLMFFGINLWIIDF